LTPSRKTVNLGFLGRAYFQRYLEHSAGVAQPVHGLRPCSSNIRGN
jgi:hypothetical protein